MPVNEKFLQARAAEQRQRATTHLPLPPPFRVPLRAGDFYRVDQVHYTERLRLEFVLLGNPLLLPGEHAASLDQVLQVLWRLHPLFYRRSTRSFPNLAGQPLATLWLRFESWRESRRLRRVLARSALALTVHQLRARLRAADQDEPASDGEPGEALPSPAAPPVNQWDDLADYYSRLWSVPPGYVLDMPRALLWQLHRNRLLAQPEGELLVIDPSDSLLAQ